MLPARYLLVHDNISAGKKSLNAGWPFFAFTQALTAIVATTALASCPLIVPGEFQLTATTCLSWLCVLTGAGLFLSRSATLQHEHRLQLLLADAHNRLSLTRTLDGLNEQVAGRVGDRASGAVFSGVGNCRLLKRSHLLRFG